MNGDNETIRQNNNGDNRKVEKKRKEKHHYNYKNIYIKN